MFKNYLKIAWRNLKRNKIYSSINIGGLALALAVFIIIILFVRHEYSYDDFFSQTDQIYRVLMVNKNGPTSGKAQIQLPEPIAGQLEKLYPEVKQSVKVTGPFDNILLSGKNKFYSNKVAYVGSSFFKIFNFPFISGKPSTSLKGPNNIVITQKLAKKLFGTTNVIGKQVHIRLGSEKTYTVTGILKNLPSNTHFKIAAFIRRPASYSKLTSWNIYTNQTYLKLRNPEDAASLQTKLPEYVKRHDHFKKGEVKNYPNLKLQPVMAIHLHPKGETGTNSRTFYIQILAIVAGLILLIACINYMNNSTAQSSRRAREIGIRKSLGSLRRQVIGQVMMESLLTCTAAFIIALALVELFNPFTLRYFDIHITSLYHFSVGWIGFLIGLLLVVSILSGAYAAFYLSSFQPSKVLKGTMQSGKNAGLFRKVLVVTQFAISIAIIIGSFLIAQQMKFVTTSQLNNQADQIMVIHNTDPGFSKHFAAFKNELKKQNAIYSVSAGTIPTQIGMVATYRNSDSSGASTTTVNFFGVKYDYFKTMGLKLLSGRPFNPKRASDSVQVIILTKSYAKQLGYTKALGQKLKNPRGKLIGIAQDFHSETLFKKEKPVVFRISNPKISRMANILVRLKRGHISDGIQQVKQVWNDFEPTRPLNYSFLDRIFAQNYKVELRLKKVFYVFAGFSIFIACLGLFGLAAFAAERRTKEIGIRKVMGASVRNIVSLLGKDFLKLVIIGFIIAIPIAWFGIHQWLQKFAYKAEISPWIFILAGAIALLIALATVSWQSIRAALANPVDSLRSE